MQLAEKPLAELVIFGAGGHARVCAEVAQAMGIRVAAFCVGHQCPNGHDVNGINVGTSDYADALFVGIGDNKGRRAIFEDFERRGKILPTLIHPSAVVSPSVTIGAGTVVMPGVIVNANARIGRFCILNTRCSIDHDGDIEDGAQICPGVSIAGNVSIGADAFIGTGASVIPKVRIGSRATVGAGSVVIRDVADGAIVMGVPAKARKPS